MASSATSVDSGFHGPRLAVTAAGAADRSKTATEAAVETVREAVTEMMREAVEPLHHHD
jgi:hypothetical protein